jgi:SPP1 family predicted phage head-tail adaptor
MTDILNRRMFSELYRFYPNTCTIQQVTETQDAAGQAIKSWSDTLMVALACRVVPASGGERQQATGIYAVMTHTINLDGYYPAIVEKMRAVVGATNYNILLVMHSTDMVTELVCQVVR